METKACGNSEFYNKQDSDSNACLWFYTLHLITKLGNRIYFYKILKKQIAEYSNSLKFSALKMGKTKIYIFFKSNLLKKVP